MELYDVGAGIFKKSARTARTGRFEQHIPCSSLQLKAEVDRDMAVLRDVAVQDVYNALQAQFGSIQVSQYEQYSRVWNVIFQSDAPVPQQPRRHHPPLYALKK